MLKKALSLMVICTLALTVAACGPKRDIAVETPTPAPDNSGQSTETDTPKPEKLTIWANESEKEVASIRHITSLFTAETGIQVEVVPMNAREQSKTFSLDGPAGKGPDLWWATHNSMGKNVLQGLAEPYELDEETLKNYSQETINAVTIDGKIYNLPMVVETAVMYYNKQLLPEKPETWKELEGYAATYTNASKNQYGFLIDGTNFYYTNMFMQGNGGYIFGYDKDKGYDIEDIGLNNEGSLKGAQLIQSWFAKEYLPKSITGDVMDGLFKEGKVGAVVSVPASLMNYLDSLGDNLGVATIPTLENGEHSPSFLGLKGWVLSPYSKNKEWATKLALYMTNQASLEHHFVTAGEVPATQGVLTSELITKDPYFSAVAEQSKYATPTPNNPEISQTWEPMKNAYVFLSQGDDAQEVLDEAVSQIKEQILINNSSK
ncbi:arabinogalactan oligomer/maltooligosaccharide transport system substrate-binding protein [Paenibacillus anaericanus]|uniref:extracellular solute-binding protein n=1 Tax=Paenibacillus anaericanus TaxID=170367 RepID=UPI00277FB581|nr:extracellular solute-binding protein [Paenibacillus anaericanus]MDQ0090275.1 arabinogalactan oligomer/maltooligosaccharide transport system substrate-binding protein [Paenibacillus anaericanus]